MASDRPGSPPKPTMGWLVSSTRNVVTFNAEGKTDILVRSGDRNVFIAECKFWRGPAEFAKTIDQLLGYLT